MKLTLSQVSEAVHNAFQATLALPKPQTAPAIAIGENATLRTDVYTGPEGSGFAVTALLDLGWRKLAIVMQQGPETHRDHPAPPIDDLLKECTAKRAEAYEVRKCSDKDYVDAITKQFSTDTIIKAAGNAQLAAVLTARLQIKIDFPKPQ